MAEKDSSGHPSASQEPDRTPAESSKDVAEAKVDAFAKALTHNIAELLNLKETEARESVARGVARVFMDSRAKEIQAAVAADRAKEGRKDPEALDQALQDAMTALGQCQSLFTGITLMLNTGNGEPISLSMMGEDLADAACAAADKATHEAGREIVEEADHA